MRYCETCQRLFSEAICPTCLEDTGRPPKPKDFVLLTQREAIWKDTLGDVLTKNGIAYTTKGDLGAGISMKIGPGFEHFQFYVPYHKLEEATALTEQLFSLPEGEGERSPAVELREILEKFADSGWSLIATPAKEWLSGHGDAETLLAVILQADRECGSCGCSMDPLYKRAIELMINT